MRATIKLELLKDVTTEQKYAVGAEIFLDGELHKVASLYINAESGNNALYAGIERTLSELPDDVHDVVLRSSHMQFYKRRELTRRFKIISNGRPLYFQLNRKIKSLLLLALDAIERKSDCVAKIN